MLANSEMICRSPREIYCTISYLMVPLRIIIVREIHWNRFKFYFYPGFMPIKLNINMQSCDSSPHWHINKQQEGTNMIFWTVFPLLYSKNSSLSNSIISGECNAMGDNTCHTRGCG